MSYCPQRPCPGEQTNEGGVPRGAKTHDYYRVGDIPNRFDNPGPCPQGLNVCGPPSGLPGVPCAPWVAAQIPPSSPMKAPEYYVPSKYCAQGLNARTVYNGGNPIASCAYPQEPAKLLANQPKPEACLPTSDWFQGYGVKKQHPLYMTTNSLYGGKAPCVHNMPTQFHSRTQEFSDRLGKCGMYRNYSLNTEMDKTKI